MSELCDVDRDVLPPKRRHRWVPVKGLRGFWSTIAGIKSFTCACGAHLHEGRKGRLYSNFAGSGDPGPLWGDFRQNILLSRKTPMPPCTRTK